MSFLNWVGTEDQNLKPIDGELAKWLVGPRVGLFPANDYPTFNYLMRDSLVGFDLTGSLDLAQTPSGLTLDDFEEKVNNLQLITDLKEYEEAVDDYAKNWMEEFLYYLPLYSLDPYLFFSPDLFGLNSKIGLLRSIFSGLNWNTQPSLGDPSTLNIGRSILDDFAEVNVVTTPDYATLIMFDEDLKPHPDLAIQWENSDWIVNDTLTIKNGKHKFVIRDDAYWYQPFPSKYFNFTAQTHKISAKDFAFSFDLNKPFWIPPIYQLSIDTTQREHFALFHSYSMNETENSISFYTEQPSIMDLSMLSRMNPIPEFYFNQTIVYNDNLNGTPAELMDMGLFTHPFFSDTFNEFIRPSPNGEFLSWSGTGISSGPYALTSGTEAKFKLRDDYWFPNEWDSPDGDFILHQDGLEIPFLNTFNDTASTQQKPTEYPFDLLNYDTPWSGYNLSSFLSREIDLALSYPSQEINEFSELYNSNLVNVEPILGKTSGETIFFDFKDNEHIRKYNVRKAIATAINKTALVQALGGFTSTLDSPIFIGHEKYYKDDWKISYDYNKARDLKREEGYDALEEPFLNPIAAQPNIQTIFVPEDNLNVSVIPTILVLLGFTLLTRRRLQLSKNNQR